jgi:hypothetical protein
MGAMQDYTDTNSRQISVRFANSLLEKLGDDDKGYMLIKSLISFFEGEVKEGTVKTDRKIDNEPWFDKRISFRISEPMHKVIVACAKEFNKNKSQVVRAIVREAILKIENPFREFLLEKWKHTRHLRGSM